MHCLFSAVAGSTLSHSFRNDPDFADEYTAVRCFLVLITMLIALGALAGCQMPRQYMVRHGEPDLISDETRDHLRMYLPGDDVEPWRNATTILYYLDEKVQVRFRQGQVKKSVIPDDELESLQATRTLLEAIDAGDERLDW